MIDSGTDRGIIAWLDEFRSHHLGPDINISSSRFIRCNTASLPKKWGPYALPSAVT
jgi:hypothetical protein